MAIEVAVHELSKAYGGVPVLCGISFEVQAGEIFGLLGPNGAGKTTTLECLIGLRKFDGGTVRVSGYDVAREPLRVKQKIGVVLQETALPEAITPREALRLFSAFHRQPVPVETLLERFGLEENAGVRYGKLSGGQRQRLALAVAFVNQPEIVFLDEPTAGLDPLARRTAHAEIRRMKKEGRTVLLTTHYLDEAEQLCDQVVMIDQGSVVAAGTPLELIAQSGMTQLVTLTTTRSLAGEELTSLPGVQDVQRDGCAIRFRTTEPNRAIDAITRVLTREQIEIVEMQVRKASLDDVFVGLMRKDRMEEPTPSQT